MQKHQIVAIILGIILFIVSSIPVFVTKMGNYNLAHPKVVGVFLYPTIGVVVAAIIIFVAFVKNKKE